MAPARPRALFDVQMQPNGTCTLQVTVDKSLRSDALTATLEDSNSPRCLTVTLTFAIGDELRTHQVRFPGMRLKYKRTSYDNKSFKKSCTIDVKVLADPSARQFPDLPVFGNAKLTSFPLICNSCQAVLADARPEYSIQLEDSEALLEAASGCCRHPHGTEHGESSEPSAKKRKTGPCPIQKFIEIDDGCPVMGEEYLNPNTVTLDGSIISCTACKTVIGRKRGLTGQFEFEPFLADFNGGKILAMYASDIHYFYARLADSDPASYRTIADYRGEPQMLTCLPNFRTAAIVDECVDTVKTATTAICMMYTFQPNMVDENFGTKVYFPDAVIGRLKKIFSGDDHTFKCFNINIGHWDVGIVPMV